MRFRIYEGRVDSTARLALLASRAGSANRLVRWAACTAAVSGSIGISPNSGRHGKDRNCAGNSPCVRFEPLHSVPVALTPKISAVHVATVCMFLTAMGASGVNKRAFWRSPRQKVSLAFFFLTLGLNLGGCTPL